MATFNLVFNDSLDGNIILPIEADNAISAIKKEISMEGSHKYERISQQINKKSLRLAISSYNTLLKNEIEAGRNATLLKVYKKRFN